MEVYQVFKWIHLWKFSYVAAPLSIFLEIVSMKTKIKLEIDYLYNLHLFLSLYSAVRCAVLTAPMEKTVKRLQPLF